MGMTYFKRYRMEIDLRRQLFERPILPSDYQLVSWNDSQVAEHASAKYESFCFEIDADVFPCLGDEEGCLKLMREISRRDGFLPDATWLLLHHGANGPDYCGTVQGVRDKKSGAIQNLGITPRHRAHGLGTILLHQAMLGFQSVGLDRAFLEVTAQNRRAVRLYERLGFRRIKTVYKAADVAYA